jgi:hypothetical protein
LNPLIEPGIEPLVAALNELDHISTVYSCAGHFDRAPDPRFLPTAYVTFDAADTRSFISLFERLEKLGRAEGETSLRLTYDCVLGRYTLSVWAVSVDLEPAAKRSVIDGVVRNIADAVSAHTASPLLSVKNDGAEDSSYPCCETIPPCTLVIPQAELICPFT